MSTEKCGNCARRDGPGFERDLLTDMKRYENSGCSRCELTIRSIAIVPEFLSAPLHRSRSLCANARLARGETMSSAAWHNSCGPVVPRQWLLPGKALRADAGSLVCSRENAEGTRLGHNAEAALVPLQSAHEKTFHGPAH